MKNNSKPSIFAPPINPNTDTMTCTHGNTFDRKNFTQDGLPKGEYEDCTFNNCLFTNCNLSGCVFVDCRFSGCDLSMAQTVDTALRGVQFVNCKLMGVRFERCNSFGLSFSFEGCRLDYAVFYKLKIRKTVFRHSQLTEADFTQCDLTGALFDLCDLSGAVFSASVIEKVDFRSAHNYTIAPDDNRIKGAKFALPGIAGLLGKYDIVIE